MTNNVSPSPTARETHSSIPRLGKTQGKRSAELLAAFRAQVVDTPETDALTSLAGTVGARIINNLAGGEGAQAGLNYVGARSVAFYALVKQQVEKYTGSSPFVMLDIASGLSPLGFRIARDFPSTKVMEVDLEEVIETKRSRIKQKFPIPANWELYAADLGVTSLDEVVEGKAHLIAAAGLNPYFEREIVVDIAKGVHQMLEPGGLYLSDMAWETGMTHFATASRMFSRQAGRYLCVVPDEEAAKEIYREAGFDEVIIKKPSVMAEDLTDIPTPVIDYCFFVQAFKKS